MDGEVRTLKTLRSYDGCDPIKFSKAPVLIHKLEVEEGFLDGMALDFAPGLNVIVGPRGVGKTSVIELLRFALGARGYTQRSEAAALTHARSVLGEGRVTLTVSEKGETFHLVRNAGEEKPRIVPSSDFTRPIVLAQNEVEQVGLEPASRLRLLDSFRRRPGGPTADETAAVAAIQSLTAEIQSLARTIRAVDDRLATLADSDADYDSVRAEVEVLSASLKASEPDRLRAEQLSQMSAQSQVRREALTEAAHATASWANDLRRFAERAPTPRWPSVAGELDVIKVLAAAIGSARHALVGIADALMDAVEQTTHATEETQRQLVEIQTHERQLRRDLEAINEGAGQASQRLSAIQAALAQRDALREQIAELRERIESLRLERSRRLNELDQARQARSQARIDVAVQINDALGPTICVQVKRNAGIDYYVSALAELLQGSGLHYNSLAPHLAQLVSPREFAEAVESGAVGTLALLARLPEDRAHRIIASADKPALSEVLTTQLEDYVEVTLLHESVPKSTQELSTGQRCTAILSILLLHDERVLILDQPEDHLDNAYVVDTLVRSLRERRSDAQAIVATHNANIPVLGEAKRVTVLGSDGKRGYVVASAALDTPEIVAAISDIMEGGAEAFKLRADFYSKHLA